MHFYAQITPLLLQKQVNTIIIPALGLDAGKTQVKEGTCRRWLHKLGYSVTEAKKGVYFDGHERPDVVEYRQKFLAEVKKYDQYVVSGCL